MLLPLDASDPTVKFADSFAKSEEENVTTTVCCPPAGIENEVVEKVNLGLELMILLILSVALPLLLMVILLVVEVPVKDVKLTGEMEIILEGGTLYIA